MKPIPAGPPEHSTAFVHPPLVRRLSVASLVTCAVGCLAALALPLLRPGEDNTILVVSCLSLFGSCLYLSIDMVRSCGDKVVVTDEGLWNLSPNRPSVFIAWEEIADVCAQNVMQRLVVTDRTGARRIHLEYHLEGFGKLRQAVLDRSARRTTGGEESAAPVAAPPGRTA
jgi:hypothetical protein